MTGNFAYCRGALGWEQTLVGTKYPGILSALFFAGVAILFLFAARFVYKTYLTPGARARRAIVKEEKSLALPVYRQSARASVLQKFGAAAHQDATFPVPTPRCLSLKPPIPPKPMWPRAKMDLATVLGLHAEDPEEEEDPKDRLVKVNINDI